MPTSYGRYPMKGAFVHKGGSVRKVVTREISKGGQEGMVGCLNARGEWGGPVVEVGVFWVCLKDKVGSQQVHEGGLCAGAEKSQHGVFFLGGFIGGLA